MHRVAWFAAVLALAASTASADTYTYVGSVANNFQNPPSCCPDSPAPLVILGEYNTAGPSASSPIMFPTNGIVTQVFFYGGNYNFTVYTLTRVSSGAGEQTFKVDDAQTFTGTAATSGHQGLNTKGLTVHAGDFLAFAGTGPFYPQSPNDANASDATYGNSPSSFAATPPAPGATFTVGLNGNGATTYDYVPNTFSNQGRSYAIGVEFEGAGTDAPLPLWAYVALAGAIFVAAGRKFRGDLQ